MKKIMFILLAFVSVFTTSCSDEDVPSSFDEPQLTNLPKSIIIKNSVDSVLINIDFAYSINNLLTSTKYAYNKYMFDVADNYELTFGYGYKYELLSVNRGGNKSFSYSFDYSEPNMISCIDVATSSEKKRYITDGKYVTSLKSKSSTDATDFDNVSDFVYDSNNNIIKNTNTLFVADYTYDSNKHFLSLLNTNPIQMVMLQDFLYEDLFGIEFTGLMNKNNRTSAIKTITAGGTMNITSTPTYNSLGMLEEVNYSDGTNQYIVDIIYFK